MYIATVPAREINAIAEALAEDLMTNWAALRPALASDLGVSETYLDDVLDTHTQHIINEIYNARSRGGKANN